MNRREFMAAAACGLAVPSFIGSHAKAGTIRVLRAKPGQAPLMGDHGPATAVWTYDGRVPGPVIRARQGESLRLRFENGLPQPSTIHWHGIRIDNAMDGVAGLTQDAVAPGGAFDYVFTPPDAGTYWYHPHNRSWEQVARGLYGLLIVEERNPPLVDQDLVFVADDWRLTEEGQIDEASLGHMRDWSHAGRLGNWLTVNGVSQPEIPVRSGERIRLRLANCANARVLRFVFEDHVPKVIALDGQPLPNPGDLDGGRVVLAPGQRADLLIDLQLGPGSTAGIMEVSNAAPVEAARFVYHPSEVRRESPLPSPHPLPANPLPSAPDLDGAQRIEVLMEGGAMGRMSGARHRGKQLSMRELVSAGQVWALNGTAGMTEEPLLRIERGQVAILDLINETAWPHAMHLHGHHFTEVERNGRRQTGLPWRDTVLLDIEDRVAIAFLADNPGKWMFHCHMLEHQAGGMGTWIEVTA